MTRFEVGDPGQEGDWGLVDWHLNRDLSLADVDKIVSLARQGYPSWRIAARFKTNQRRVVRICRIEGVEVAS